MPDIQQYSVSIKFKTEGAESTEAKMEKLEKQLDRLKTAGKKNDFSKSIGLDKIGATASKFSGIIKGVLGAQVITKLTKEIGSLTSQTADYIETVNLFRTSMGDLSSDAMEFIKRGESELGLDPQAMMDSISSFQNLSEGIGIASDRAYIMSKNLTQLSGDLSSLANISFEDAQKKLLSGFSGQVQPLRKYGIALDQASLQETAYSLGLQQKVKDMTRAQKTELIYYQIMKSTQKMQGDLGKSIMSPANALRVMQNEFKSLGRAIGTIFIPVLMQIIPVVRIVTRVLTSAAQAIANFFKIDLGNYDSDLSSVGNLLNGMSDDIDGVGDSADETAKKLNKMLMPFDELNNINFDTGSSSIGAGAGDLSGGTLGIELPEYDMFASVTDSMEETINEIKAMLSKIFEPFRKSWDTYGAGVINSIKYAFEGIFGLINTIGMSLAQVWTNGSGEKILGTIFQIWQNIFNIIGNVSTVFKNAWKMDENGTKIIQGLVDIFTNLYEVILLVTQAVEEFTSSPEFQSYANAMIKTIQTLITTFKSWTDKIKELWEKDGNETLKNAMGAFTRLAEVIGLAFNVLSPILDVFFTNNFEQFEKLMQGIDEILKLLNGLLDFVIGIFTGDWERAWNGIQVIFERVWKTIERIFGTIFGILTNPFENAYKSISNTLGNIRGLFNFNWKLPDLKLPHLSWSTQQVSGTVGNILRALNLPAQLPKLNISWYAQGGFPELGQLFFAGEAGPELIGNIGNRTAVANQDQITTAIANATYNAISRALAENQSNDRQPQLIQVIVGNQEVYRGYGQYKDEESNMLGVSL